MNGLELFLLGRRLMKLGEDAIPPSGFQQLAASVRSVLADALTHPGSSISDITERTGFPQSHVSASVARLRDLGALVTDADPADRRRTLVHPAPGIIARGIQHASVPVDQTIIKALEAADQDQAAEVVAALELLARLLTPHALAPAGPAQAGPASE
jgi:DNA-binding MarR family transcriptional regulator